MANRNTATKASILPAANARKVRNLDKPEYYFNRELSWLEFNQRVLEEAQDAKNPPLERLKFLSIVSSNLDEFFEIRVAGLQQQAEARPHSAEADGLTPQQTLDAIGARAQRMVADQYRCYSDVVRVLAQHDIHLLTLADLDTKGRKWAAEYFEREVFPVLTPLAVDPAHPFPQLLNKSLNLAVVLSIPETYSGVHRDDLEGGLRFGVVQMPRVLPRLVKVPDAVAGEHTNYVFLSSLISEYAGQLFPGLDVAGCYAFRVTRNSELYLDEDEADNLLEAMQEQLQRRRRGDAVRLEVQRGCDPHVSRMLLDTFCLDEVDLYEVDGPVNLMRLMSVYLSENRPDLKDAPFRPAMTPALHLCESADEMFGAIRQGDILLHHPYDQFKSVIEFITQAANDPQVLAIKQTLYRISGDSPIIQALMRAAENGKQVTVLVELKARFDEENNIQWARAMEEAGVHVLYGLVGLKTHSKMALVVRREDSGIHHYVHLGTGNYNEVTAHLYTDVGLVSADPDLGGDAAKIFNLLTGISQLPELKKLKMAPFGLQEHFVRLIEREASYARRAQKLKNKNTGAKNKSASQPPAKSPSYPQPPRIIAKMNALVDYGVIQALYRASQAGVQIDLIVRGICCLRPGIPGVSENIRVRSIVDRFLEHSRIFYFSNEGREEIWCGSADWMPRNFYRRVEVMFPVEDPALKARLRAEVLELALQDNVKARLICADGTHTRVKKAPRAAPVRYQAELIKRAVKARADAGLASDYFLEQRPAAPPMMITPVSSAPTLAPPSADSRPGTQGDPVLQSVSGTNQDERPESEDTLNPASLSNPERDEHHATETTTKAATAEAATTGTQNDQHSRKRRKDNAVPDEVK